MNQEEYKALQEQIVADRRALHKIPELGLHLPMTQAYVVGRLEEMGADYRLNKSDSGIVVTIDSGKPGKVFALRADMDGLPIHEETGLPFRSTNGCMHACGHDTHTAMMLGTCRLLLANKDKFKGIVKILFQTGEETANGSRAMIADGALENPSVDGILGLHIGVIFPHLKVGQIGIYPGYPMASYDKFVVKVKGYGCHGSQPQSGHDPIMAAVQIISTLQTVTSREVSPTTPDVISVGSIHGGDTYNVIPSNVIFEGTFRAMNEETRQLLARRISEISAGIASVMGCEAETEIVWGAPAVYNDPALTKIVTEAAKGILGEDMVDVNLPNPTMGGEDFAYYQQKVPGTFVLLSSANPEKGTTVPHHNPHFDVDEDVFWEGCAVMAESAFRFLNQ